MISQYQGVNFISFRRLKILIFAIFSIQFGLQFCNHDSFIWKSKDGAGITHFLFYFIKPPLMFISKSLFNTAEVATSRESFCNKFWVFQYQLNLNRYVNIYHFLFFSPAIFFFAFRYDKSYYSYMFWHHFLSLKGHLDDFHLGHLWTFWIIKLWNDYITWNRVFTYEFKKLFATMHGTFHVVRLKILLCWLYFVQFCLKLCHVLFKPLLGTNFVPGNLLHIQDAAFLPHSARSSIFDKDLWRKLIWKDHLAYNTLGTLLASLARSPIRKFHLFQYHFRK